MARKKGSKDKKKRMIRNALIGAAGLGAVGGAAYLGHKYLGSTGRHQRYLDSLGKGSKKKAKTFSGGFKEEAAKSFTESGGNKSGVGGYKGMSKAQRQELIGRRKNLIQRQLDLDIRAKRDRLGMSKSEGVGREQSNLLSRKSRPKMVDRKTNRRAERVGDKSERLKAVQKAVGKYGARY